MCPKIFFSKLWHAFHLAFFFIKKIIIFPFWNLIFVGSLFEDNWKKWIPGSSMGEIHYDGWWIRVKTDVKVHTSLDVTLKVRSRLFEVRKYIIWLWNYRGYRPFSFGKFLLVILVSVVTSFGDFLFFKLCAFTYPLNIPVYFVGMQCSSKIVSIIFCGN